MKKIAYIIIAVAEVFCSSCADYNHDQPNTKKNQAAFEKHIGFPPPSDVDNLYGYADEFGADVTYLLGFTANQSTVNKIISKLSLSQTDPELGWPTSLQFDWWKQSDLETLKPFWKTNHKNDYFWFLWYDQKTKQIWYCEFST